MFDFEAAKKWEKQMDEYAIKLRRNKAKACLSSMKHYRDIGDKRAYLYAKSCFKEAYAMYRQTVKVLMK